MMIILQVRFSNVGLGLLTTIIRIIFFLIYILFYTFGFAVKLGCAVE